jgi:hypothetical protein
MRRKNFSTKKRGTDDVVALDVNQDDPESADSFMCQSKIPGMVLVDFISGMDEDDPAAMGAMLKGFFEAAIKPEELERFMAYTRATENEVEIEDLAEMAGWLAEQYSGGNPTELLSASSGGSTPSGPGNVDELSAEAVTSPA